MRIAMVLTAFALVLIPLAAKSHGPAQWIMDNPRMTWCCSEEDCIPADGRVTFGEDGYYHVEGLTGRKREGDVGFYRLLHLHRPWFCAMPGTTELRCLILPEADG